MADSPRIAAVLHRQRDGTYAVEPEDPRAGVVKSRLVRRGTRLVPTVKCHVRAYEAHPLHGDLIEIVEVNDGTFPATVAAAEVRPSDVIYLTEGLTAKVAVVEVEDHPQGPVHLVWIEHWELPLVVGSDSAVIVVERRETDRPTFTARLDSSEPPIYTVEDSDANPFLCIRLNDRLLPLLCPGAFHLDPAEVALEDPNDPKRTHRVTEVADGSYPRTEPAMSLLVGDRICYGTHTGVVSRVAGIMGNLHIHMNGHLFPLVVSPEAYIPVAERGRRVPAPAGEHRDRPVQEPAPSP